MKQPAELDAYFAEAASWDEDRVAQSRRSARTAWWVAVASFVCVLILSAALVVMLPLRRTEAFLVRVDGRSGIVDVVPPLDGQASVDDTVTRYLLTHYVRTCERFNWSTAESDYLECAAFHGTQRNQQWAKAWATTNPLSPLNHYQDGTSVRVQVQSLTFFRRANGLRDLVQVRYAKAERRADAAAEHLTHWIATLQYAYGRPARDLKVRTWNPLGLRVLEFQAEQEAPEANPTTTASLPAEESP